MYDLEELTTLDNKKTKVCLSGFRDVKMFRGIPHTPARGWFPQINEGGGGGGGVKSRFLTFLAYCAQNCSATLERSRECSWIEWTLLPPLIPLVRPGS